jgi:hypothetical protein
MLRLVLNSFTFPVRIGHSVEIGYLRMTFCRRLKSKFSPQRSSVQILRVVAVSYVVLAHGDIATLVLSRARLIPSKAFTRSFLSLVVVTIY